MRNGQSWKAVICAAFAEALTAAPDKRARDSIQRLEETIKDRREVLARATQRIAGDL